MADDKAHPRRTDRRRLATGEAYEVGYFAQKHGIPRGEAGRIIHEAGGDRAKANAAAERAKRGTGD